MDFIHSTSFLSFSYLFLKENSSCETRGDVLVVERTSILFYGPLIYFSIQGIHFSTPYHNKVHFLSLCNLLDRAWRDSKRSSSYTQSSNEYFRNGKFPCLFWFSPSTENASPAVYLHYRRQLQPFWFTFAAKPLSCFISTWTSFSRWTSVTTRVELHCTSPCFMVIIRSASVCFGTARL